MRLKVLVSAGLMFTLSVVSVVAFASSLAIEKQNQQREQENQQMVIEERSGVLGASDNLEFLLQRGDYIFYANKEE